MKKKLISVLAAISLSAMLTACGDKDITGNYVNIANNDDVLTVTKSQKNAKLYFIESKGKSSPYINLGVQKEGNELLLNSDRQKVGIVDNDTIIIKYQKINETYKKK
ncbi:hypothetical protein IO44_11410 [Gallibacterium anatis str. Avicor]|uniref:hypothetical protein n=1 Tax=Gallibacterium anatis TaxID=750 RepID=UPI000530E71C|nr:hypothetical protein [Gallibacterium anatis]KGQ53038.1 hypothetical protein IO44_11410 [Gallibacterium anatis str. Avicor]